MNCAQYCKESAFYISVRDYYYSFVGTDYSIDSSLTVPIAAASSGDRYCIDVSTIEDNLSEGTEQFELYFDNLPSDFATAGTRDTVCVSILDDEGNYVRPIQCGWHENAYMHATHTPAWSLMA